MNWHILMEVFWGAIDETHIFTASTAILMTAIVIAAMAIKSRRKIMNYFSIESILLISAYTVTSVLIFLYSKKLIIIPRNLILGVKMFYELREYRILPGQMDNWVNFMQEVIIPFQSGQGMIIVGSFTSTEEDDLYIWMRRFENEQDRVNLYEKVYESQTWKSEIGPKNPINDG
ncbi:MAG: hypothetical protein CM1200mP38_4890 [Dehalococcoidia bacterium]|nr:MAG: hypothetical protein CM1200mP38_4890 [Dehalococcoidia bacterium]